jgi:hypothetical protein
MTMAGDFTVGRGSCRRIIITIPMAIMIIMTVSIDYWKGVGVTGSPMKYFRLEVMCEYFDESTNEIVSLLMILRC